ncbi:MAG: hypothetical protein OJF50_000699 [Nitrospira sp.]|jgi:hypothetical protein|nr:hypothetical protein [Nitrospira sp.]
MSIVIESRVLYSSHDMEVTSDDAMDHRTVLGGGHYRTHVHSGIEMAGVEGMTYNDSEKRVRSNKVIVCYGHVVAWSLS